MISYAITDPSTLNFNTLQDDLKRFSKKADIIVYRDKNSQNYSSSAKAFINEAKRYNFKKILLHSNIELASKLNADGIHLTSMQFDQISFAKTKGLFTAISTHSVYEAKLAQKLGADIITYSPIFSTPNKGKPLGVDAIKELKDIITIPIIALGGILTQAQINNCKNNGASGFASIRYFG